ncbi:MAG: class I fructose-bisphosphate aldolase [Candidatus Woesearchaeota archaeon]
MKKIKIDRIMKKDKIMMLSYDHGFEHGPKDLNTKTADPNYVLDIALEGRYTALVLQTGIADKYYMSYFKDVPLIIKLNGRTTHPKGDPLSLQHTSVKHALELGAAGVGYTIYLGSLHEQQMFVEFGRICEQAHNAGIPVICWMHPRGEGVNEQDTDTIAYAARCAMELGADVVEVKYNGDAEGMRWITKCAGKTKVIIAGGEKHPDEQFLKAVHEATQAGAVGVAVGRNIWQHDEPLEITKKLKDVLFEGKAPKDALRK